tara:strand:- start:62099 stop:62449 length:351 start_codon:yes stop_codon:yes gene_type:complete
MRNALFFLALLAGCSNQTNQGGSPLLQQVSGLSTIAGNAIYSQRRGAVELLVKSNHPALVDQINAGAGPVLSQVMETAGIPVPDRPTRIIQLQSNLGLYAANPGALVTTLMLWTQP